MISSGWDSVRPVRALGRRPETDLDRGPRIGALVRRALRASTALGLSHAPVALCVPQAILKHGLCQFDV